MYTGDHHVMSYVLLFKNQLLINFILKYACLFSGFGLGYGPIVFMLQGEKSMPVQVCENLSFVMRIIVSWCPALEDVLQSSSTSILKSYPGELLPADMRSFGCALLGVIDNISLFISVKLVPTIIASLGE